MVGKVIAHQRIEPVVVAVEVGRGDGHELSIPCGRRLVGRLGEEGPTAIGQEGAHHKSGDLVRHARTVRPGADEALTRHAALLESRRAMKLLHTADWHVGKTIRGQSRLAEHRAVLADIVRIADAESADVVLVAGDLYETAAPNPDAEALVLKTLLDLRETGRRSSSSRATTTTGRGSRRCVRCSRRWVSW